jgi:glycosyltransferase involved in cell wall biosynthesis
MFKLLPQKDLIIVDDYFPNLMTGFRIAEYNYLLERYKHSEVYSSHGDFEKLINEYASIYPKLTRRIKLYDEQKDYRTKLFYTVFLNNAYKFLPTFERLKTPFVFTLYPGGGLLLNHDVSCDEKLRAVLSSPYCSRVIVTQKATRDYLIDNHFCSIDKIEFIYGVVTASEYFTEHRFPKKHYRKDKKTFDICFVAHKYMARGVDKGYDRFVAVAKILSKSNADFRFHVVGGYDNSDISLGALADNFTFYGSREKSFFPEFYASMDILLSAVVPFKSYPGAFDGFPTTCCSDAALCGTAVFTTDPLSSNIMFKDKSDIVIVPPDNRKIAEAILNYYFDPLSLYKLSAQGLETFSKVYDLENQMAPRIKCLQAALGSS